VTGRATKCLDQTSAEALDVVFGISALERVHGNHRPGEALRARQCLMICCKGHDIAAALGEFA